MMQKLIILLCIFSLVAASGCATRKYDIPVYLPNENSKLISFNPGSEPEEFNGIKWETELSTLIGMKLYRTDPSHGGIKFYLKEGDTFKLCNGKLKTIQYGFCRGKFYVGMVTTQGLADWNNLRESIFNKFGGGAKPFMNKDEYLWIGENAVMTLRYDDISKLGTFYIRSDSMAKQIEGYRREVR